MNRDEIDGAQDLESDAINTPELSRRGKYKMGIKRASNLQKGSISHLFQ